jgi:hypothetical protein
MPRHADWMKRWESFRYIVDALRAYIDRKPLRVETEPDWPLVVELASKQLVSPTIGLVLHDPLGGQFDGSGFLAHLHSTMVTMSQKSFVLQPAKSVSQALTPGKQDRARQEPRRDRPSSTLNIHR